jgi:exo-1,4-beta-D-glucosaminidase
MRNSDALLLERWQIRSAFLVRDDGAAVSSDSFEAEGWLDADVPCTALGALVEDGVYPDPRIGLNLFEIPDASDAFNEAHGLCEKTYLPEGRNPWRDPYWFRTTFELDPWRAGEHVWLQFDCLNYRADIWLNGCRIADREAVCGMFLRFRFDVTDAARPGRNDLAVCVYGVDHPGEPGVALEPFCPHRRFQKDILKDVTEVMSVGYDCFPPVPDRNLGLIQDVRVWTTGPVTVAHPFVRSALPEGKDGPAHLTVSCEMANLSGERQEAVLACSVPEAGIAFERAVALDPGERREIRLTASDVPSLIIDAPRLWWPRKYGPQNLYTLVLEARLGGAVSDAETAPFGIRTVERELHRRGGFYGLRFILNGEKLTLRGGYIQPECLFDWDAERMETEIRYLLAANLDFVCFEDIPNPPAEFMEVCDRLGMMVWLDYFGCYWSKYEERLPLDLELLERCTIDITRRYRNHPSLTLYMCMNEGHPHEDIYRMWRRHVRDLDGTRLVIPTGSFMDWPDSPADREPFKTAEPFHEPRPVPDWIRPDTPVGINDWYPKTYGWLPPAEYYRWVREYGNWMFMLESASASVPEPETLSRFIPDLDEHNDGPLAPLSPTWAHHGANQYFEPADTALRRRFGPIRGVRDYCAKANLNSIEQNRALFEAVNHRLWEITSGFGYWKLNAGWPSIQWQFYDYYLRPTASYYYVRKACAPIHVQFSPLDGAVTLVNAGLTPLSGCRVSASAYGFDMKERERIDGEAETAANTYRDLFTVSEPIDPGPVWFVALSLTGPGGEPLSSDVYWMPQGGLETDEDCYRPLEELPSVPLDAGAEVVEEGEETVIQARVRNPSETIALATRLRVLRSDTNEEILPVFWEDNYFSLAPGEERVVRCRIAANALAGRTHVLAVSGWNVEDRTYA